jgi:bifunctional NMN adenylyltransferase/nudix hydrolase
MPDVVGNNEWAGNVQKVVQGVIDQDIKKANANCYPDRPDDFLKIEFNPTIKIIGHKKDHTSFYLDMFPQWKNIDTSNIDDLHATDIRKQMFELEQLDGTGIPEKIVDYLNAFMNKEEFDNLKNEYDHIQDYRKGWANSPHPPIFNTVDAVVVQSGHVLLIRRRHAPGKGLWALPGGFVNQHERINDAVVRELKEETKIKVPEPVLRSKVEAEVMKVFDDPKRSLRGRTITFAYYIELPPGPLPRVRGSDDADKAKWVPLSTFDKMEDQLFEDHYRITKHFINAAND